MHTITKEKAKEIIESTNGRVFTVEFKKKNNEHRVMTCRTGVKKYVKGVGMRYDPSKYNLIPVFDMQKRKEVSKGEDAYRMIPINRLEKIVYNGKSYYVG